jgi:hypothetical protein
MECAQMEITSIERTVNEIVEREICDLSDLQLALIGGGIGEVIVA